MVSYPDARTIATTVHAVLFGVYISTFFQCLRWLVFIDEGWIKRKNINRTTLIGTLMIFVLSTADLGISLWGALSSVTATFHSSSVFLLIVESITTIITDGILVFRCWIVCYKSWRVVSGLLLLLLCSIACFVAMTYWAVVEFVAQKNLFHLQIIRLHEVFLVCNIIIDVYATSAIILQIRKNCFSRHLLHFATRIVAESGLSYTITSLMFLVAISVQDAPASLHLPRMVIQAIRYPIAGITFNVILIRAAYHRDRRSATSLPSLDFVALAGSSPQIDGNSDRELGFGSRKGSSDFP